MKIGFAIAPYQQYSGVGVYYHQLINEMVRLHPDNQYWIYLPRESVVEAEAKYPDVNIVGINVPNGPSWKRALYTFWYQNVNRHYGPASLDLLHSFSFPGFACESVNVLTVYDMRDEDIPVLNSPMRNYYRRFMKRRSLRKFDGFAAISEFTHQRFIYHYPEVAPRVHVIPLSGGERFGTNLVRAREKTENKEAPYILAVSHIMPRKNLAILVKAFDVMLEKTSLPYNLMIVGRRYEKDAAFDAALREARFKDRIEIRSSLTEEELEKVYIKASLFVHPALYEGFGIPLLEAAAFGLPVLAADSSSLPEVVGNVECLFSPCDYDMLAQKMERVLSDAEFRLRLCESTKQAAGKYSWIKTAEMTYSFYETLIAHSGKTNHG